jgi:hypothetical protein
MWAACDTKNERTGFLQMKIHCIEAHVAAMFRFSPAFAILNLVLLVVAFVRIYSVIWQVREAEIKLLELINDLEKRYFAIVFKYF